MRPYNHMLKSTGKLWLTLTDIEEGDVADFKYLVGKRYIDDENGFKYETTRVFVEDRITSTQEVIPLIAKMKTEAAITKVPRRRKKTPSGNTIVLLNGTARPAVQKLSLEMKIRTKSKLPEHKIKHDRQDNGDKRRKGGMYADTDEADFEIDPHLHLTNLNASREWVD